MRTNIARHAPLPVMISDLDGIVNRGLVTTRRPSGANTTARRSARLIASSAGVTRRSPSL
jgi:hypothetical protein